MGDLILSKASDEESLILLTGDTGYIGDLANVVASDHPTRRLPANGQACLRRKSLSKSSANQYISMAVSNFEQI